jgi:hypothetical protein
VRGLLRRLLSGGTREAKAKPADPGVPWYMRQEQRVTPERIEAARQRLKQAIPPPESDGPQPGA